MNGTAIKICGLRDQAAVEAVAALGDRIRYAGFVFAESRRRVTPEAVRRLDLTRLAARRVGVFVDPDPALVRAAVEAASLQVLQFSGDEPPEVVEAYRRAWGLSVIKAMDAAAGPEAAERWLGGGRPPFDVLLLDAKRPGAFGGTGTAFDWEMLPEWQAFARAHGLSLWVAGGLRPENVGALVRRFRPDGVDVSSGVETGGQKDAAKIRRFVEAVAAAEAVTTEATDEGGRRETAPPR
ncbi:phosphoribosylanthranilate isomerase [Hydrogenibacillus sp. N12]|uniref:phosphoribosylanthranilate isomerase n=1 Tax=Hydrogenibacillus sp. N12 TaxID=2866627 RepID=UPI001C7D81D9|nr:phosphoribosylanthranilate isomerase [Hydrogenibacillus sp. N12]QZA33782.1 phosphoribosylanthranilate isomerase [Hydrogenibacillus sp. N12]